MSHADIGPSGLERVLACPGSHALSVGEPRTSSYDSRLGTAAHELGARCLAEERDAAFFIGETIVVEGEPFVVDDEMAGFVQVYVDHVRRLPGDGVLVEQRVTVPVIDTWGTADAIRPHAAAATLYVVDLKYGKGVFVSGRDNPQLKAYAWGAYSMFSVVDDIEHVEVAIVQPRIDNIMSERYTVAELEAWAHGVAPRVAQARDLAARHAAGEDVALDLAPGGHCRFCPAKAKCPAVRALVVDTTGIEFEDLGAPPVSNGEGGVSKAEGRGAELAAALPKLDLIEDWVRETRAAALRHLEAGGEIPGYKLVEGRRGHRTWANADAVETLMKQKFRLPVDDMYEKKVIGPAAAERLLAKESPRRWQQLTQHITQSPGRPTVVPAGDKRRAISQTAVADAFDDLA